MKILTFYFSGSGNTRWAAETLDRMLKDCGHESALAAVDGIDMAAYLQSLPDTLDCVGFALPVYAADIPRIMRRSIREFAEAGKALPNVARKLFFINTYAYVNGSGIFEARKLFRRSPFRIVWYRNIRMINSAPQKHPDAQKQGTLDGRSKKAAEKELAVFVKRLESGKGQIGGVGPQLVGGKLVRALLRGAIRGNYRRMRVDLRACTRCMQCVRNCPAHCIQYQEQTDTFTFSEACEACMRCYHGCPAHAIANVKP